MDIIQQIAVELVEAVLTILEKDGLNDVGNTINDLKPVISKTALDIVAAYLKEMDDALCAGAKALRKTDGITVKERNISRSILTNAGELTYHRTYFKLKDGSFVYLLDQLIGVEEYERLSKEYVASLLNAATVKSYQNAVDTTGRSVSRQTVHNRLVALKDLAADVEPVKETPETLDLFVDEDHVHLTPKGSAVVPLVTITEGMDQSSPNRHKTVNSFYVAAYGMSQDAFDENVAAVLNERYNMSCVRQINLHADGGKWIVGLNNRLPRSRIVMDGYHLEKYIRSFLRLNGANRYAGAVRAALKDMDGLKKIEQYCSKVYELQDSEPDKKKVLDFREYCSRHWESIVLRMQKTTCGSCTEAQVSHVLSDRLSRNPLAWSKAGLSKMTMLLAYSKNGCRVAANDVRISVGKQADNDFRRNGYEKYARYAKQQADDAMRAFHNCDFFEPEHFSFSKVDGTYLIRKSLGSMRSLSDIIA